MVLTQECLEPYRGSHRLSGMANDTKRKALGGMSTFVAVIFLIAIALAAFYLFGMTPGEA